jgi:hypothetical protein
MRRELSTTSANSTATQSTKILKERTTKVRFADEDEINILQPVDPELKSTLYYSREELSLIQRRFQVALVLRRQAQRLNEFKQALKDNQIYINHLREDRATTKRSFQEKTDVSTKRRRLNPLALVVV